MSGNALGRVTVVAAVVALITAGSSLPAKARVEAIAALPGRATVTKAATLGGTSARTATDPVGVASGLARRSGVSVEVSSLTTDRSRTLARPDGTFTAEISAVPVRVRRGGGWVPVDTTLRLVGGVATPASVGFDVAFSAGGSGMPLARLVVGGVGVALWWPWPLPVPSLSGASAMYPQVLAGVDLRVTATGEGFTEVLVVHDRAAGLRLLAAPPRLRVQTQGGALQGDGVGGLRVVDSSGAVVMAAPTAVMWDAGAGAGSESVGRVARVGLGVLGSTVTLNLDRAMVVDPLSRYPLFVDPSFTAATSNWTNPLEESPGVSFWNGQNLIDPNDPNGPIEVGLDPSVACNSAGQPCKRARAMFQMNTAPVNGKHILGATFRITEGWAWSCTASEVDLFWTGGISSATTWNSQLSSWKAKQSSVTAAKKNGQSGSCGPGQLAFDVTGLVRQAAAGNWPNMTVGLIAPGEGNGSPGSGDVNSWKRFMKDAAVQVDYNSVPSVGTRTTSPATACVAGSGSSPASNDPLVNTATPTLQAVAVDADSADNNERGTFAWQRWSGTAWGPSSAATDPIARAAGTVTQVTVPALTDGTYRWQVQISEPLQSPYSGTDTSSWSSWCEFGVDTTAPPAPAVASTQYSGGCGACGGPGVTGTFTLSAGAPDVTAYWWGFSDPPANRVNPSSAGGGISFAWTPPSGGPRTLFVQSQDAAGNRSAEGRYQFTVGTPTPAKAHWPLTENGGQVLVDDTGGGNSATVASGTLGVTSRLVGVGALGLNGTSDYAQTAGSVLDTGGSFSVSAWVKLTDTTASHVAVSQSGTHSSGFVLQYDASRSRWSFAAATADQVNPGANFAAASQSAPVVGVWTHLTGVYDAASGQASLYVNGQLQATVTAVAPTWNATGPLLLGRGLSNDAPNAFWAGSLSDVRVWQRVVSSSEIQTMIDPAASPVGIYDFEDANSPTTFDGSNASNDLTLEGDATIPLSGAGHDGLGMLLMDGAGWAQGLNSSVHTDQSFTVSVWVRLDGTALPTQNRTAVAQDGGKYSGFYLGYRLVNNAPTWAFTMPSADGDPSTVWTSAATTAISTADLGQWRQLVGVYDGSTRGMRLYVNGTLVGSATGPAAGWDAHGVLTVGGGLYTPSGGATGRAELWTGAIDQLRVYPGAVATPLGDWQFDNCTGAPVVCADSGSGSHPVTLFGATWSQSGHIGSGLSFDGTGAASTNGSVVDTSRSFTVGAWVSLGTLPATGDAVAVAQAGTHIDSFELGYRSDLHEWCFTAYSADSATAAPVSACAGAPATGIWTHLAGEYDATAGQLRLYVNGSLVATSAFNSGWVSSGSLLVGRGWRGDQASAFASGTVDGLQVYSGVLADPSTIE